MLCDEDIDFCCKLLLKITFNCDDWKWIQNVCIDIINSNREKNICGLAVTCIGHLARIHGKIEKERIFELFNQQKDNPFINDRIGDAIDDIETEIFNREEREIPSTEVVEIVMDRLKELDPVAYVRFASVYREFKDVNTFMDELKKMLGEQ